MLSFTLSIYSYRSRGGYGRGNYIGGETCFDEKESYYCNRLSSDVLMSLGMGGIDPREQEKWAGSAVNPPERAGNDRQRSSLRRICREEYGLYGTEVLTQYKAYTGQCNRKSCTDR